MTAPTARERLIVALDLPTAAAAAIPTLGADALLVTPGVRPLGSATDDQTRCATPVAAIRAGASHLVVGRPVTQAPDPAAAARSVANEISAALAK